MTGPAYYRPRVSPSLVIALLLSAVLVGLYFAARSTVTMIRQSESARVHGEAQRFATTMFTAQRAAWARRLDSLRNELVVRDSAAGASAYEARGAIAMLRQQLAVKPTTLRETLIVAAVERAVNACTAAANDCDQFRATTATTLAIADSTHRADSTAFRGLTFRMTASNDSLRDTRHALERAPSWSTVIKSDIVSAAAGALLCLVFCK